MLRNLNQSAGGRRICGVPQVGILAATIAAQTASGDNGPGLLYDDSLQPGNAGKQLRCRVTAWPAGGTVFVEENGAFQATGFGDGLYTLNYAVDADGVQIGTDSATFSVGPVAGSAPGGTGTGAGSGSGGTAAGSGVAPGGIGTGSGNGSGGTASGGAAGAASAQGGTGTGVGSGSGGTAAGQGAGAASGGTGAGAGSGSGGAPAGQGAATAAGGTGTGTGAGSGGYPSVPGQLSAADIDPDYRVSASRNFIVSRVIRHGAH